MNYAQFVATQDTLYCGGMRWWIKHAAPDMTRYLALEYARRDTFLVGYQHSLRRDVLAVFQDRGECDISEVAARVAASRGQVIDALKKLAQSGALTRTGRLRYRRAI